MSNSEPVSQEKFKSILWSHISFVRESNSSEKKKFSEVRDGWFYTFGLKSGQNFVAHFPFSLTGPVRFRPINHLIPNLREIYSTNAYAVARFSSNLSDSEKRKYHLFKVKHASKNGEQKSYRMYIPMIVRADKIHPLLSNWLTLSKGLFVCQDRLKAQLIPEEKNTPTVASTEKTKIVSSRRNGYASRIDRSRGRD